MRINNRSVWMCNIITDTDILIGGSEFLIDLKLQTQEEILMMG